MPCYDPETNDRPERLQEKVHNLTALLCYACHELERIDPQCIKDNIQLRDWYIKHLKADKIREELEKKGRDNFNVGDYRNLSTIEEDIKVKL